MPSYMKSVNFLYASNELTEQNLKLKPSPRPKKQDAAYVPQALGQGELWFARAQVDPQECLFPHLSGKGC